MALKTFCYLKQPLNARRHKINSQLESFLWISIVCLEKVTGTNRDSTGFSGCSPGSQRKQTACESALYKPRRDGRHTICYTLQLSDIFQKPFNRDRTIETCCRGRSSKRQGVEHAWSASTPFFYRFRSVMINFVVCLNILGMWTTSQQNRFN